MQKTKIEYCDYSSNPMKFEIDGVPGTHNLCVVTAPGCTRCYAADITKRFFPKGHEFGGYTQTMMSRATPVMVESELHKLRTFKPKPPFVNGEKPSVFLEDMSDLFGPWASAELLKPLFDVIDERQDVIFIILTKRPENIRKMWPEKRVTAVVDPVLGRKRTMSLGGCTRPNVWLLTSISEQETADRNIPLLRECRGLSPVLGVSYEPALGPVDFSSWIFDRASEIREAWNGPFAMNWDQADACISHPLSFCIVGGESGHNARPFDVAWARNTIEQCKTASVPCFVKQLSHRPIENDAHARCLWPPGTEFQRDGDNVRVLLTHSKGGEMSEWPEGIRVRQFPESVHA